MAQPPPYDRSYNFHDYQAENPLKPLPADKLDEEFSRVKTTLDAVLQNLALIQRDDTALANKSVGYDQLKDEIQLGFNPPTDWMANHNYVARDTVFVDVSIYRCLVSHISSNDFEDDLNAGYWELVVDFASVQTAAIAARDAALQAQADAEAAQQAAEDARDDAIAAKNDAEGFKNDAEAARDAAAGSASSALSSASAASASASTAATHASNASNSASAASSSASSANNAKVAAENARDASVVAQGLAEAAQAGAEQAQADAEAAQQAAEDARDDALQAQADAESARDAAIGAKNDAEAAKTASESARDASVVAKGLAEAAQAGAEAAQQAAEDARDDAIAAKNQAEGFKDDAEAALDDFSGRYLGAYAADPAGTLAGQMYFNTTTNLMMVYDGASWVQVASGGDMRTSVYDPNGVAADAFNMDNMVEGASNKILTAAERADIAANTSARHSHGNKAVLDATEEAFTTALLNAITANTSARHSHSNKSILDATEQAFTTTLKNKLDGALQSSGGTMSGPLTLSGNPTNALHAVTKQYVDGNFVSFSQAQSLTPTQQEQARENIGIYRVSDISSIKDLDPNQVKSVYLDSGGRSGEFVWTPGDHSAVVAADTLNGLYIAPNSDPSGASGAWVRKFDGDEALVDWWGAVGDKNMDCSAAFQAAVDTLSARIVGGSFGGTLVLGVGDYRLGTKVDWKPRVSMRGSGRNSTYIRSLGESITNMINVENISTGGVSFKSFTIVGAALQTYAFAVGSVLEETSGLVFEDIRFIQHITSVRPLHTYAMFDGTFKDCRFDQCDRGLIVAGSQINIENCSFSQNSYGVVIRKHVAPSIGGGKFFGGVFAGNTFDVVLDGDMIRPTAFYGTWFEGTKTSVIAQINAPSVLLLLGLVFKDCLFQPAASALGAGFALMGNWAGRMAVENCTIYQTPKAGADVPGSGWTAPQTGRARYTVYGTILTDGTEAGTLKRADVDIG